MSIPFHELSVGFGIGWVLFASVLGLVEQPSLKLAEIVSLVVRATVGSALFSACMIELGVLVAQSMRALHAAGLSRDNAENVALFGMLVLAGAGTVGLDRWSKSRVRRAAE
jgi:hypothetical protein